MTKLPLFITSLLPAVVAGFLAYLMVDVFLSNAETLSGLLMGVVGLTLAASATVAIVPIGVLVFTPAAEKAETDEDEVEADEEADEMDLLDTEETDKAEDWEQDDADYDEFSMSDDMPKEVDAEITAEEETDAVEGVEDEDAFAETMTMPVADSEEAAFDLDGLDDEDIFADDAEDDFGGDETAEFVVPQEEGGEDADEMDLFASDDAEDTVEVAEADDEDIFADDEDDEFDGFELDFEDKK